MAVFPEAERQIHGRGRFPHATFPGCDCYNVFDAADATAGDAPSGARRPAVSAVSVTIALATPGKALTASSADFRTGS